MTSTEVNCLSTPLVSDVPADFGTWLRGFAPIQLQQHLWVLTLITDIIWFSCFKHWLNQNNRISRKHDSFGFCMLNSPIFSFFTPFVDVLPDFVHAKRQAKKGKVIFSLLFTAAAFINFFPPLHPEQTRQRDKQQGCETPRGERKGNARRLRHIKASSVSWLDETLLKQDAFFFLSSFLPYVDFL